MMSVVVVSVGVGWRGCRWNGVDVFLDADGELLDFVGERIDLIEENPGKFCVVIIERPLRASTNAACLFRIRPLAILASTTASRLR